MLVAIFYHVCLGWPNKDSISTCNRKTYNLDRLHKQLYKSNHLRIDKQVNIIGSFIF